MKQKQWTSIPPELVEQIKISDDCLPDKNIYIDKNTLILFISG